MPFDDEKDENAGYAEYAENAKFAGHVRHELEMKILPGDLFDMYDYVEISSYMSSNMIMYMTS